MVAHIRRGEAGRRRHSASAADQRRPGTPPGAISDIALFVDDSRYMINDISDRAAAPPDRSSTRRGQTGANICAIKKFLVSAAEQNRRPGR
jgi:hypothetical protein